MILAQLDGDPDMAASDGMMNICNNKASYHQIFLTRSFSIAAPDAKSAMKHAQLAMLA
jgi:hypothetical protein